MSNFDFQWAGTGLLWTVLKKPIKAASLTMHGIMPGTLTLWHADGTFLSIRSNMVDLDDLREAGVLVFEQVFENPQYEQIRQFNSAPLIVDKIYRLTVEEDGERLIEAGVELLIDGHGPIKVIAGSFPYALAIDGLFQIPRIFETEYEIDAYEKLEIT